MEHGVYQEVKSQEESWNLIHGDVTILSLESHKQLTGNQQRLMSSFMFTLSCLSEQPALIILHLIIMTLTADKFITLHSV